MSGRATGRARGRAGGPTGPTDSPSPPGGGSPNSDHGNGNGNGNGNGGGDAIRGRGSMFQGSLYPKTRPDGKSSKAESGKGEPIHLFANYFRVKAKEDNVLTDYRVDFEPDVEMVKARRKMVASQAALFGGAYVFDGKSNLKSIQKAPNPETTVTIPNEATGEPVQITFRESREIGWFDEEMLRFLNTQLRRNFQSIKYVQIFRHYFNLDLSVNLEQHNLKIMQGLATAIAHHDGGLLMVCDTISKIVQNTTVLDLLSVLRRQHGQDWLNAAKRKIVGQTVMTAYNNRSYKIDDIDTTMTAESTFERRGINISFVKYYKEQHDIQINQPKQPLLVVNPTKREERIAAQNNKVAHKIQLVPELCYITGLTDEQFADFNLKRVMTQSTQLEPMKKFNAMRDFAKKLQDNPEVQASLNQWDIKYDQMPLAITGRVLPGEMVYMDGDVNCQRGISFNPQTASFEREMRSKKMFDPGNAARVTDWVIFVARRNEADAKDFADTLHKVATPLGMSLSRPRTEVLSDDRASSFHSALSNKSNGAQLIVCVVPNNDKSRYDLIKKYCYCVRGVASQVIVARTLSKKQQLMSVCTKVGIQVATKLGAAPWSFKIPPKNLMVIGFDTYHDGTRKGESVGGLVASLNSSLTRYYSRVHYHRNRDEMSGGVATLFRGALMKYRQVNGMLPKTIIFYRDGVGDGMIKHVFDVEVNALTAVLQEIAGDEAIQFAFCIVTKRINTRFFKKLPERQLGNPPPGTIIDGDVTRPERYEFFCVSQSVRAGTVSPTNYNIIYDTTPFKPENMQMLVYKLTHLYFNWAGTIRVPAPCQYAHKLAYLTGTSLHEEPMASIADNLFYL